MDLSDIIVFNRVADSLSFVKAARQLGSSRSLVSKRITRLEKSLGVQLISRNPRKSCLTEAGRRFYESTAAIDRLIEEAIDNARTSHFDPNGTIKFSIPSGLAALVMHAVTTRFQPSWPDIHLDIHLEDGDIDLVGAGYDLMLRFSSELPDSRLVSRSVARCRRILAASPAYLEKHGTPEALTDLAAHRCLEMSTRSDCERRWKFSTHDGPITIDCDFSLEANNAMALVMAARLGQGIVYLPDIYLADELASGQLVRVLPGCFEPEFESIRAVYACRNLPFKVRLLIETLEQALETLDSAAETPALEALDSTAVPSAAGH